MQNNLPKIIIIILVLTIVIVSVVGTTLYLKTDLFKSKDMLFKKYISQNLADMEDVFSVRDEMELLKLLGENDYTEILDGQIKYLENEDDEEEVYKITAKGVGNKEEESIYRRIAVSYKDENLLQMDVLKQNNILGVNLSNIVQQYVSVENKNISYLISSMGYDGEYFSEKFSGIDFSQIFDFSNEEIEALKADYIAEIFKDIDKSDYKVTRNAIITLADDSSVTTTAYSLTINQNELDKMSKRVLNKAISDEAILRKIDELSQALKNAGFVEQNGKTLKDIYVSNLQKKIDELEYTGENKSEIIIKVYESKGKTLRTEITTEERKITIDLLDIDNGEKIALKTEVYTEEGSDINTYSISKEIEEGVIKKKLSYNIGEDKSFELKTELSYDEEQNELRAYGYTGYSNESISNLSFEANITYNVGKRKTIPDMFTEGSNVPNIILNNYDGDKIVEILNDLRDRQIASLEQKQAIVNTKMLNNILLWIDANKKAYEEKQQNDEETKKQRFNNKFELYAGEDLSQEHVQRLINSVSSNMADFRAENGKIVINIQNGVENKEKAEQISKAITDKHTYNVKISYGEDGYINEILISVYTED